MVAMVAAVAEVDEELVAMGLELARAVEVRERQLGSGAA